MVDGYDYDGWKSLHDAKCIDAFEHYSKTLKNIDTELNVITIHPGKKDDFLPAGISLEDFDGIVWTGSSLNIYDLTPPITKQIVVELVGAKFKGHASEGFLYKIFAVEFL